MITDRPVEYLVGLVNELRKLPQETALVEFKENNDDAQEIGEYISALANSAALAGEDYAYLLWGITDTDHLVVGTSFSPCSAKKGKEDLESWLLRLLVPRIPFHFFEIFVEGRPVVMLQIERAFLHPVQFQGQEFIRIGSYKKTLRDFPEIERALWRVFDRAPFENGTAAERVSDDDVLRLLDYSAYFDLLGSPRPESDEGILESLTSDGLIHPCEAGGWTVTNLGGILFANRLEEFPFLHRKAMRVTQYRDSTRIEALREQVFSKGYACGFEDMIDFINGLLPSYQVIEDGQTRSTLMFPELAVRELLANALVHQDFLVTGTGPMVEIFDSRIEITNPGSPLVDARRFVDTPPKSRNEALASLMRRIGICQELGSGWDKVVFETERYRLPAPLTETGEEFTRVVLFAPRAFSEMDQEDRTRAIYFHTCLRYVNRGHVTNATVRTRFGLDSKRSAIASRLIKEAVVAGAIVPYDAAAAPKFMRYIPFWAPPLRHQIAPWVLDRTGPVQGVN